jgi:hypothetical protein
VAQLARQHGAALATIYLPCPLVRSHSPSSAQVHYLIPMPVRDVTLLSWRRAQGVAQQRNAQRAQRVPEEVLARMAARLDPPDPARHAWERATVTLPALDLPPAQPFSAPVQPWLSPLPRPETLLLPRSQVPPR